jgi:proteic killer suppression protein
MIKSFKCKETAKIWDIGESRKFPPEIVKRAIVKLAMLNRSSSLQDLSIPPSNHLEKLSGDRDGQYSIRINGQFRACFRWSDDGPDDVEIVDYH